jgi:hypothetical protein
VTPCQDPIEYKIYSFAELKEGWNFGEGMAPNKSVIDRAISIYRIGKRLCLDAQVFPVANGDIEISLYMRDHFMDILVRNDGKMEFSYEIGIGKKYKKVERIENIDMDGVEKRLCELPKLCGVLESLEIITTRGKSDSYLAVLPITKGGFRFLIENASQNVIRPLSANTLGPSMAPAS